MLFLEHPDINWSPGIISSNPMNYYNRDAEKYRSMRRCRHIKHELIWERVIV